MPDTGLLFAFIVATILLMLIPGPNVALIVANSLARGARHGLLTVAGTACGMAPQLALVAMGLAGMASLAGQAFVWLRWAGAAYLVVLGIRAWRAADTGVAVEAQACSPGVVFARAVLVSVTNPKTLLFVGAFLPQFVSSHAPAGPQMALLAGLFIAIAVVIDTLWALLAARLRGGLAISARLRVRLAGGLLMGAGAGLAVAR